MTDNERRNRAKEFAKYWADKGYEKGESQPFWLSLLRDVLGVEHPEQFINFEEQAKLDHTSFIDGHISATHVLIEQKSRGKDLRKAIRQSDGTLLTPFQQAQRYSAVLPYSLRPRWIVTCNFEEFLVYDMEKPHGEPESILLKNLGKEYYRLQFLVDTGDDNIRREMEVSIKAGRLVGKLYDEILKQYHDTTDPHILQSLNMLCVRLVFCLYAEDAGVFGGHNKFYNYINSYSARDMRKALIDLFRILNTKDRDEYEDEALLQFPYVNGGLFADSDIVIPQFNDAIRDLLLNQASADFDWSDISPTIFGAVFESTLNPETRRSGGMHYTSIENIHKVIDPLFLDDLRAEFEEIKQTKVAKTRAKKLSDFRDKLGALTFFDPACGSGNFLTETYICLRRLENEAIKLQEGDQILLDMGDTIKVTIDQFYGIEINDFAVTVAKTALWIAESQMMKETEDIIHKDLDFLPLTSNAYIVEGNALRLDWESVVPKDKLNYIMGNPPFVGKKEQTKEQKSDLFTLLSKVTKKSGTIDYVCGWFYIASKFIQQYPHIRAAFVATDSICQGEHVPTMWNVLVKNNNIKIDFAHKTFKWSNETTNNAEVYCIIVGFSSQDRKHNSYVIYSNGVPHKVNRINSYLIDAPDIWLQSKSMQISGHNKICYGSMPIDNGHLILSVEDYERLKITEPSALNYIRKYAGAEELLKGKIRYCLWLKEATRKDIINSRFISDRVAKCRLFRESSNREATKKLAIYPELFGEIRQPNKSMIVIPKVSSKHRKYIPILNVESSEYIINGSTLMIADGNLFEFGVLSSCVHNAWLRVIAETWGHSYQYSTDIYNNFPFPSITEEYRLSIENTASKIIETRNKHKDLTIAEMYSPKLGLLPDLYKVHEENDKAVIKAYGFKENISESEMVAELMKMYQELTSK